MRLAEKQEAGANKFVVITTTIIMGSIAVATAWSGFQAAKWGGQISSLSSDANAACSNSVKAALTANQQTILDVQLFIEWVNAIADDDTERADFYYRRMREEVKPAIEAWRATNPLDNPDAPSSPFVMEEYVPALRIEANELEDRAASLRQQAEEANEIVDEYVLTTVILASGLFFAGLATRFPWDRIEYTILIVAAVVFAYGVFRLASFPRFF